MQLSNMKQCRGVLCKEAMASSCSASSRIIQHTYLATGTYVDAADKLFEAVTVFHVLSEGQDCITHSPI
jgi:hypothetical protein